MGIGSSTIHGLTYPFTYSCLCSLWYSSTDFSWISWIFYGCFWGAPRWWVVFWYLVLWKRAGRIFWRSLEGWVFRGGFWLEGEREGEEEERLSSGSSGSIRVEELRGFLVDWGGFVFLLVSVLNPSSFSPSPSYSFSFFFPPE